MIKKLLKNYKKQKTVKSLKKKKKKNCCKQFLKCPLTQHLNLLPKFITYKCLYYRGALNNRVRKVESKGKCTMLDSCHWVKISDKKTHFQRFLGPG